MQETKGMACDAFCNLINLVNDGAGSLHSEFRLTTAGPFGFEMADN